MQRDELRALQAPLKQRYRDDPSAALATLRAERRRLLELTERYRVVYQTRRRRPGPSVACRDQG